MDSNLELKVKTMGRKPKNSGLFLTSSTSCVASSVDNNIRQENLAYYGKIEDTI